MVDVISAPPSSGPMKPRRLRPGDSVAIVSMAWGGPFVFPHVFDAGLSAIERLGLRPVEFPTARMDPEQLSADPQARAADLNAAFADETVSAIFSSIGGEDSARVLRYLDADLIAASPKVVMGYSDTTTLLVFCDRLGLVSFHGPSVMAGLAQLGHFPRAEAHLRAMLFEPADRYRYQPYPEWVDSYLDWNEPGSGSSVGEPRPHDGWHWLNGSGVHAGRLFGGSVEVLEFLKGTPYWPAETAWDGRLLFFETTEEVPTIEQVRRWLFNYGVQGVFERIGGLLFGRARGYSDADKGALDEMIRDTVVGQFGASELTIVTNMDFGHTDPQWILPLGVTAELDNDQRTFQLIETAVS